LQLLVRAHLLDCLLDLSLDNLDLLYFDLFLKITAFDILSHLNRLLIRILGFLLLILIVVGLLLIVPGLQESLLLKLDPCGWFRLRVYFFRRLVLLLLLDRLLSGGGW